MADSEQLLSSTLKSARLPGPPQGVRLCATVLSVYDGDTCTLAVQHDGTCWQYVCRLLGLDSPEIRTGASRTLALEAKQQLANVLRPDCEPSRVACKHTCKAVTLDPASTGSKYIMEVTFEGTDKYGRHLARLYSDKGVCINEMLLQEMPTLFRPYWGGSKEQLT
jgi:endonuclease YncB( thermonuclease family)